MANSLISLSVDDYNEIMSRLDEYEDRINALEESNDEDIEEDIENEPYDEVKPEALIE